ncbi:MAG: hypothetical protein IKU05_05145 [Bacteroidales bacterium]|nr:hypothetical protein [Bacteroidales bacterium]
MWLLALAIGLVYASLLYLFSKKYSKGLTVLLFALRTIVVATVVMLFVNPYIKQRSYKIEKPIVILAQDNSESIVLSKDSVFYKEKYPQLIDSIANVLEKDYDVEKLLFGGSVILTDDFNSRHFDRPQGVEKSTAIERSRFLDKLEMTYSEQFTNISNVLNTIQRQYFKKNVGAVVLLSDGIVNQGVNPELIIENYNFPIYSVTFGDTVAYPSMIIKDVKYNKTVPANMLFPLRVTANATNYKGQDMNVIVKMDGNEVENVTIPVTSSRFSKTLDFNIDSGDEGTKQIDIIVGKSSKRIFVNVSDKKYRILCLARAPHPDIAAIKSALDDHFEFDVVYDNAGANNDLLVQYDLLILHDIATRSSIPTSSIIGSNFDTFNESQDIVSINRGAANTNLDVRGRFNNAFGLFTISSDIKNELKSYPPLALPHCEIAFNGRHDDALLMNVMDIETPNPLLAFANDNDGNKHAFFFGTGCWRWKLYEYFHHKNNDGFNEIISKTVKYLLTEKDKELTINHKESYLNTESISISAELRNPSRELINEPDLHITINNQYEYVFSKGENNYHLNIGMLPEGIYNYCAHTSFGSVDYKVNGTFTVESIGIEAQDLTANIERMRSLASQTGGKHHYITDIHHIIKDLEDDSRITSISREDTRYDDLINLKWLFFSILALITIEWLLRKIFGIY